MFLQVYVSEFVKILKCRMLNSRSCIGWCSMTICGGKKTFIEHNKCFWQCSDKEGCCPVDRMNSIWDADFVIGDQCHNQCKSEARQSKEFPITYKKCMADFARKLTDYTKVPCVTVSRFIKKITIINFIEACF